MRKRVCVVLAVLGIAVGTVLAWQALPRSECEPVYRGKSVEYWFGHYAAHWPRGTFEERNAFRQSGERAATYLARRLAAPDHLGHGTSRFLTAT